MNKIKPGNRALGWVCFIAYLIFLAYFLFFAESMGRTSRSSVEYSYNLEPFKEILRFCIYRKSLGLWAFSINILGNVIAFIPFGFFRPIIGRHRHSFIKTVIWGAAFSLGVELMQLYLHVGSFDVDDIILNTLGSIIGYIIFSLTVARWLRDGKNV